jgi:hypothetical protein
MSIQQRYNIVKTIWRSILRGSTPAAASICLAETQICGRDRVMVWIGQRPAALTAIKVYEVWRP